MEIPLANPLARALLLLLVILAALALAVPAARMAIANYYAGGTPPESFERAIRLEPDDAENYYRLGRYWELDFEHADPSRAVALLQSAVALDPNSAFYWMDLGDTLETNGQIEQADQAYAKAYECYPMSARVAWRYGNFLLREGKADEAFAEIKRAVVSDPKLAPPASALVWRVTQDPARLLALLPRRLDDYRSARDSFLRNGELDPALGVWNGMVSLGMPVELKDSFGLIDGLIANERIAQAWSVWKQALAASGTTLPAATEGSAITDGSFEADAPGGGFGWRLEPILGVSYDFDASVAHAGNRSLRITFDGGTNVDFQSVRQYAVVEPNTRYHFRGWLRTDSISTDSGVRFFLTDPSHANAVNVLSPDLTGTVNWTPFDAEFTTGPKTEILWVGLRRIPSDKFDNKIQGIAWVDDVSLTPVAGGTTPR